jgi:hypothetical protein
VLAGTESAQQVVAALPAEAEQVLALVRDSFAAGMQWGFRLVALLALVGLVVTILFVAGSIVSKRGRAGPRASPGDA